MNSRALLVLTLLAVCVATGFARRGGRRNCFGKFLEKYACDIQNQTSPELSYTKTCGCSEESAGSVPCNTNAQLQLTDKYNHSLTASFCLEQFNMFNVSVGPKGVLRHACRIETATEPVDVLYQRNCSDVTACGADGTSFSFDYNDASGTQSSATAFFCPENVQQENNNRRWWWSRYSRDQDCVRLESDYHSYRNGGHKKGGHRG